jgi:hypothetical protein
VRGLSSVGTGDAWMLAEVPDASTCRMLACGMTLSFRDMMVSNALR